MNNRAVSLMGSGRKILNWQISQHHKITLLPTLLFIFIVKLFELRISYECMVSNFPD